MVGSIVGVKFLIDTIPEVGRGPRLNVDIHRGALTEGLLTYAIVTISLGLAATKIHGSFFMKTWISSLSKLTLHILGSDLTGGCMNPAAVSIVVSEFICEFICSHLVSELWSFKPLKKLLLLLLLFFAKKR